MSAINIEEVLKYLNLARTQPKQFAKFVQEDIDSFISQTQMPLYSNCYYQVNESKQAWIECYNFLMNQQPLPPFQLNEALCLAAQDHAKDLAQNGISGHTGSDGSRMTDRIERRSQESWSGQLAENIGSDFLVEGRNHAMKTVLGLIIDDGVPSRGHRKNIFSNNSYVGIYSVVVQNQKIKTVMDFSQMNFTPKSGQSSSKEYKPPQYTQKPAQNKKPQNFASFGSFNSMMGDGGMGHIAKMKDKSEKYVVCKSTNTSKSTVNGQTTTKIVEKIKYSDGTQEQIEKVQTGGW